MKSFTSKFILGIAGCVLTSSVTFAAGNLIKNGGAEDAATVKKMAQKTDFKYQRQSFRESKFSRNQ